MEALSIEDSRTSREPWSSAMPSIIAGSPVPSHRDSLDDLRPRMAKAVKKVDEETIRAAVGLVVRRCFQLAGLSQKEGAALIGRDEAQVARWIAATERPHFDAILKQPDLQRHLIQAFAEMVQAGVELETVIRVTRRIA